MGRRVEGKLDASDLESAEAQLRGLLLTPSRIEPVDAADRTAPRRVPLGEPPPEVVAELPFLEEAPAEGEEAGTKRNAVMRLLFAIAFFLLYNLVRC